MIPAWCIKVLAVLALLAAAAGYGYHHGAQRIQALWDAQVQADKAAAEAAAEADRLRSRAAATQYETQRAAAARRLTNPPPESEYALHRSICPPPGVLGKPLEFGDVPVPDSWLDRLRGAGADF